MAEHKTPAHTGWWFAGTGTWHRYYGGALLVVRKVGPGHYLASITTDAKGKVWEVPTGTMASAKSAANNAAGNLL